MVSFNLIDYYNAINGTSSLEAGVWHTNFDKRYALKISSDYDTIDEHSDTMILPPTPSLTESVNIFSEKLGQRLNNTKITVQNDGSEIVELELDDRVVIFIIDQSGSMSWNDSSKFRYAIAQDIADKIEDNYLGDISYNLLSFGSKFVNVILFGIIEEDIDVDDLNTIEDALSINSDENFKGVRVVRTTEDVDLSYNPAGGDLMSDGFIGKMLDQSIVEGTIYYYWVYTYNSNLVMSKGRRIKVVPRVRNVPRGVSIFRSFERHSDITKGLPLIGTGISRDDNTLGIWHFNEGVGTNVFDFSSINTILTTAAEEPVWYNSEFVPTGISGMYFNGENNYAYISGRSNLWRDLNDTQPEFTVMAWVYPYKDTGVQTIVASVLDNNLNYGFVFYDKTLLFNARSTNGVREQTDDVLILNQWQHVCATYNNGTILLYHNGVLKPSNTLNTGATSTGTNYHFSIGGRITSAPTIGNFFHGKITEVSIHDTVRSSAYINAQLTTNSITDINNVEISTEITGIKDDNGDRINVLRYEVSEDYNFIGGNIKIVRNNERIPTWEEDGDEISYGTVSPGIYYIADVGDAVLGDNVYYRIYSQNTLGNFSFPSDSLSLTFEMEKPSSDVGFPTLISAIDSPVQRTGVPITTAGNRKVALKWGQLSPIDDKIKKVKIFYSSISYPVVNDDGGSNGELIFNGTTSDNFFVHTELDNNEEAYYTIVNVDRYGRSSEYNSSGNRIQDSLQSVVIPVSGNDESTIPLKDVDNLHYELVDDDSVSVIWDQPSKDPENINAFFDQTVIVYTSITDQFGIALSDDTPMRMFISSEIVRNDQADDVFSDIQPVEFEDREAYTFNVIRTDDGILKASLAMSATPSIMASITEATFEIQVKAFVPKEGYVSPTNNTVATTPLEEYAQVIEALIEEIDGSSDTITAISDNIFEYFSKKIIIKFTNPWELELVNKENMRVSERCYFLKEDEITKEKYIAVADESFNGIYMKASAPFIARVKVKYKGETVSTGSVQIAVWDADSDSLCRNASVEDSSPYEGEKIQVSSTVLSPAASLPILQGEEQIESGGETITVPISYVDIPLYAPDQPQAVWLFVKGSRAGFDSVEGMYILFQNLLKIDIQAFSPNVDGSHLAEQQAQVYIVHPDYPNINLPFDKSLITYPDDNTVVQWESIPIEGDLRNIYSIDNVPIPNGVYSYTRNGVARNVFMGPIERGTTRIEEVHEIKATVVFDGLSAQARQSINIEYEPEEYNRFSARFLMEVDGGWIGSGLDSRWGGAGWLHVKNGLLWTDGSDYKRIKISRNPRIAADSEFGSASCFRDCATQEESEVLELSSGQIVHITTGDESLEILHGNIIEEVDVYTGNHTLLVEEGSGFIDNGDAYIELNDESVSDITYFYIRANKFVPESGGINQDFELDEEPINECLCLKNPDGLFKEDLPDWEPVVYISGTTTLFVNNRPLTLIGGGDIRTGIPPCPIGLKEPLSVGIVERRVVTNRETFWVNNDQFLDSEGHTLVRDNSDVYIKVRINWKRGGVPEGTVISVRIGEGTASNLFIPSQDRYFAEVEEDGFSYVTVQLSASRVPLVTTTENIRIFSVYDENEETERNVGATVSLTIDKENEDIITPTVGGIEDVDTPVATPYSRTLDRYDILANEWSTVNNMVESRGDSFAGAVGDYFYVIGGLRGNNIDISSRNERYDTLTDTWNDMATMITPRFGGSSITIGNDIYTIGGVGIDSSEGGELDVSIAMEVYHTDTDEWESLSNMPISNQGEASEEKRGVAYGTARLVTVNSNEYIYVLCGIKSIVSGRSSVEVEEYNNVIMRYHIVNDFWEISDLLYSDELSVYSRMSPLSIYYENKIIVFNGAIDNGSELIFPNDEFSIDVTSSLVRINNNRYINFGGNFFIDRPVPKYLSAFAEYDINPSDYQSNYYILGGFNNDSANLDIMERIITFSSFLYDSSYDTSNPSLNVFSLPTAKSGASAVYIEALRGSDLVPYIYLAGGYTTARGEDFVEITFDI